jgi:hypothetical protein
MEYQINIKYSKWEALYEVLDLTKTVNVTYK